MKNKGEVLPDKVFRRNHSSECGYPRLKMEGGSRFVFNKMAAELLGLKNEQGIMLEKKGNQMLVYKDEEEGCIVVKEFGKTAMRFTYKNLGEYITQFFNLKKPKAYFSIEKSQTKGVFRLELRG